jgi:choline dehydrogenase-like flavoprotein
MSNTYDYVIVGAGSAGCVLAARLSEDPDVRVAVLEAGGPDTADELHIPAAFPATFKSGLDWDLLGEQEPGLDNRRLYLPRGRVLGGCSSVNAMIYVRGNRVDFDEWAAGGAHGWGYDDVLPYFKRSEDNERGDDAFHATGGPLSVSESRSMHPLVDTMLEAAQAAGHEHNPDFNGARQEGVGRFQLTQRDGLRCSTADAFLHPAAGRPNLDVITSAMALRIAFNEELNRAGALLALDGLLRRATRVSFKPGEKPSVTDGPFTEAKELVGGYWIIQARSKDEAVEWAMRAPIADGTIEVRRIGEAGDYSAEVAEARELSSVPPDQTVADE